MATSPPNEADLLSLLAKERQQLNAAHGEYFQSKLVPLRQIALHWEYGGYERHIAWVVADFAERNVGIVYCQGGFGSFGSPWGLISLDDHHFGQDSGWYPSLRELLDDGWVQNDT